MSPSDALAYGNETVTWLTFLRVAAVLLAGYLLLDLLRRRLERGLYLREADTPVRAGLRIVLLLAGPVIALVLAGVFVAIAPLVHGVIFAVGLLLGYRHLRDAVAGRVMRFDRSLRPGRQLSHGPLRGTIADFGITGLYLQREEGRSRLGYTALLTGGYTVAGDPSRGGFYRVRVALPPAPTAAGGGGSGTAAAGAPPPLERLRYLLIDNPYVREGFRIEAHPAHAHAGLPDDGDDDGDDPPEPLIVDVSVGVHRADHLRHLTGQLTEAGFSAQVAGR